MQIKKTLVISITLPLVVLPLMSCNSSNEDKTILRLLNMEDYIYLHNEEDGYLEDDLVVQFKNYIESDPIKKEKYGRVEVIYDTTDTNETLYSEMQTGKSHYDLICPSDYMIQKLITYDLIEPLDMDKIENYNNYASTEIKTRLDNIEAHIFNQEEPALLKDYAVGYMWGTLGLLFNPTYESYVNNSYSANEVQTDLMKWEVLWNEKYKKTISIKDSMRDTYAAGIMYAYKEELYTLKAQYENNEITSSQFNSQLSEIFNRCSKENVDDVFEVLTTLKKNIFGLEVDSGKQDIVTGKIGINLAWSGDAVYSMDQGEDPEQVGTNLKELCYSVPDSGSNIWFDAWVMPKLERSDLQRDLAHEFLNYICDPLIASKNMDYTGYTSFIAGDAILELVRDWYDIRTYEIYEEVAISEEETEFYSVFAKNSANEVYEIGYHDLISTKHDSSKDAWLLYYSPDYNGESEVNLQNLEAVYLKDDEGEATNVQKTYGDLMLVDTLSLNSEETGIEKVDLSYFFKGTLVDYSQEDTIFYSDCYLPFYYEEEGVKKHNNSVGRQFYCQYPSEETMMRCAVMRDYAKNNSYVMKMWEEFKSTALPLPMIIIFIVEIAIAAVLILYFLLSKNIKKKLRMKRYKNK